MLQGHFITMTLKDYEILRSTLLLKGSSGYIFFDLWIKLRGVTAPLFFTISGLIFTYLLQREKELPFFSQQRVKRGVWRAFIIILIGYLLQLNFTNIPYYLSGKVNERLFAFHVLNCIGFGLLFLIFVYSLSRYLKSIPLCLIHIILTIIIFAIQPFLITYDGYYPQYAPTIIQNMLKGPHSIFPIIPWFGYLTTGGAIGAFLWKKKDHLLKVKFQFQFISLSFLIAYSLRIICNCINFIAPYHYFDKIGYNFELVAAIILLLGILIIFQKFITHDNSLFLIIGQNTLTVYIVHVIILYGAVFGIGIKNWFDSNLNVWQSTLGMLLFIGSIVLIINVHNKIKRSLT